MIHYTVKLTRPAADVAMFDVSKTELAAQVSEKYQTTGKLIYELISESADSLELVEKFTWPSTAARLEWETDLDQQVKQLRLAYNAEHGIIEEIISITTDEV